MNEFELLRSMWKPRTRRKIKYIVPNITYLNDAGSLNNDHWAYIVPYAFRDALDLKFEQRKRQKEIYTVWTQGPIIAFKDGDVLHKRDNSEIVQVQFASPMGWDATKDEMHPGSVVYDSYHKTEKIARCTCNQMQFLEMLIYGKTPSGHQRQLF